MGKSRRFHKRVQKRHTRKHKPTRKKNKMKKNYSIKQRGGNAGVAIAIGAAMGLALVGWSFHDQVINNGKSEDKQRSIHDTFSDNTTRSAPDVSDLYDKRNEPPCIGNPLLEKLNETLEKAQIRADDQLPTDGKENRQAYLRIIKPMIDMTNTLCTMFPFLYRSQHMEDCEGTKYGISEQVDKIVDEVSEQYDYSKLTDSRTTEIEKEELTELINLALKLPGAKESIFEQYNCRP